MEKEKRITEIELRKKELNQEISDFNRDNVFRIILEKRISYM